MAIIYLPDSASCTRGTYAVIHWPQSLQNQILHIYRNMPPITIEPTQHQPRDLNVLDLFDLIFLWRIGEDLTDVICTYLWESHVQSQEQFEEQSLLVEEIIYVFYDISQPYLDFLPQRRWVSQRFIGEQFLVVAS